MPRRKPSSDEQTENPVLMLPAPRVVHHREHEVDPYQSPPGAVPVVTATPRNIRETRRPPKRKMTAADRRSQAAIHAEQQQRADRYDHYLDLMAETGLNEVKSLSLAYDLTEDAVRLELDRLRHDVRLGIGSSSTTKKLERNDLNEAAQIRVIRRLVYSDNAAAVAKGLDLLRDMTGNRSVADHFEVYLRLAKAQKG